MKTTTVPFLPATSSKCVSLTVGGRKPKLRRRRIQNDWCSCCRHIGPPVPKNMSTTVPALSFQCPLGRTARLACLVRSTAHNPARGQRIASEGHQQSIVERPLPVHGANRPSHNVLHRYYRSGGAPGGGKEFRFGTHYIVARIATFARLIVANCAPVSTNAVIRPSVSAQRGIVTCL